jgi:hypothetical protein
MGSVIEPALLVDDNELTILDDPVVQEPAAIRHRKDLWMGP